MQSARKGTALYAGIKIETSGAPPLGADITSSLALSIRATERSMPKCDQSGAPCPRPLQRVRRDKPWRLSSGAGRLQSDGGEDQQELAAAPIWVGRCVAEVMSTGVRADQSQPVLLS